MFFFGNRQKMLVTCLISVDMQEKTVRNRFISRKKPFFFVYYCVWDTINFFCFFSIVANLRISCLVQNNQERGKMIPMESFSPLTLIWFTLGFKEKPKKKWVLVYAWWRRFSPREIEEYGDGLRIVLFYLTWMSQNFELKNSLKMII